MICHKCESEDVTLTVMASPIIIDQVEVLAICQDCGAEHEYSIAGGDFELIEPDDGEPARLCPQTTQMAAEETHEARQ